MSEFSKEDFLPLEKTHDVDQINRPSLSYWQDARIRFFKNKQACLSAVIVTLMVALCLLGPIIWPVNPAESNLEQGYLRPSWSFTGLKALIIEDYTPKKDEIPEFIPSEKLGEVGELSVEGEATNINVRLVWQQVPGAIEYIIYRNEYKPDSKSTIGLPLGRTKKLHFDDGLKLELITYYYTLVPVGPKEMIDGYKTLEVPIRLAFTPSGAKKKGIDAEVGKEIELQAHPLGTDSLGRDILARIIQGGRISFHRDCRSIYLRYSWYTYWRLLWLLWRKSGQLDYASY